MARESLSLLVLCVTLLTIGKHVCAGPFNTIKCPFPKEVPHGSVNVPGQNQGDKVLVTCDEGYWLKGPSTKICQPDGRWSGDTYSCEVVNCPFLKDYPNSIIHYSGGQGYKATLTVECRPGYIYTEKLPRICQVNNQWTEQEGHCIHNMTEICPIAAEPVNGVVNMTGRRYNNTVTVTCEDGYQYTGTSVRVCQKDGSWSGKGGFCKVLPANCPSIQEIGNGVVNMTGRRYNDTVTVKCHEGSKYTGTSFRVCLRNGSWSGNDGLCEYIVQNVNLSKTIAISVLVPIAIIVCLMGGLIYRHRKRTSHNKETRTTIERNGQEANQMENITPDDISASHSAEYEDKETTKPLLQDQNRIMMEDRTPNNETPILPAESEKEEKIIPSLQDHKEEISKRDQTIIQHLRVDKILPLLDVGQNVKDDVNNKVGSEEKAEYLLSKLGADRKPLDDAMAAVQPELFKRVHGREPSHEERDACVIETINHLHQEIIGEKHKPDSEFDKRVDFDVNFIHLVLVNDRRGNIGHTLSIEDILPQKGVRSFSGSRGNCIILKGRAGVGKTTLLQYLCRQWAKGEWGQQFAVIFLLKMRVIMTIKEKLTLTELLTNYSQFSSDKTMLSSWIQSNLGRIGIIIDGIDELQNVACGIRDTGKITSLDFREDPVKLCVSVMKGHLMGRSTRIITSRPFISLLELEHDRLIEIYGLKDEQIHEYINKNVAEPAERERVRSMLTGVPHLMSLCQITFYCMAFCRIFGELDVNADELNTYTSIMAFVVLHYACRRNHPERPGLPTIEEDAKSFLPKLTKLASQGLKVSGGMQIVFTDDELKTVGLPVLRKNVTDDVHSNDGSEKKAQNLMRRIEETGLVQSETVPSKAGHQECITEFIHLSIQEFLGMAEIANSSDDVKYFLNKGTTDNESTLTKQFLLGLVFDSDNKWIKAVKEAVLPDETYEEEVRESITEHVKALCKSLQIEGASSLGLDPRTFKLFLLAYESQSEELANVVGAVLATQNGRLKLAYTSCTALDMKALTFVLDQGIPLTCLGLERCNLDEACLQILAKYIQGKKCPRELTLTLNNIGPEGAAHLSTALQENKTLTTLNLGANSLGPEGAAHLSTALKENMTLTTLDLDNNELGPEGAAQLSAALKENNTLTSLQLYNNGLGPEGVGHLSTALKENTTLTTLDLSENNLKPEGAAHLSTALKENKTLTTLSLNVNNLGPEGAAHLSTALKENKTLTTLNLKGNEIGDEGSLHLSEALKCNKSITKLNLQSNEIGDGGALHLSEALKCNTSITELELWGNDISYSLKTKLDESKRPSVKISYR